MSKVPRARAIRAVGTTRSRSGRYGCADWAAGLAGGTGQSTRGRTGWSAQQRM